LVTGIDRQKTTERTEVQHIALNDCRHQIKFLVLTRNDLLGSEDASDEESDPIEDIDQPPVPSAGVMSVSKRPIKQISVENATPVPVAAWPLLIPEPSFLGEILSCKDAAVPVSVAPKLLPTPEASFAEAEPPSKKPRLVPGAEAPAQK
jgi:hypothetical protein